MLPAAGSVGASLVPGLLSVRRTATTHEQCNGVPVLDELAEVPDAQVQSWRAVQDIIVVCQQIPDMEATLGMASQVTVQMHLTAQSR